jgi:hypothetical protein
LFAVILFFPTEDQPTVGGIIFLAAIMSANAIMSAEPVGKNPDNHESLSKIVESLKLAWIRMMRIASPNFFFPMQFWFCRRALWLGPVQKSGSAFSPNGVVS